MGVTGLLPQLKEIQQNVSLEKFRGKTVAIDSYAWLHRGVFSCSWELALDQSTDKYIAYFQRRIKMLDHFGITPYFVFDGDDFQSKKGTEAERLKSRLSNKERGQECLARGDKKNAAIYFSKCVDITPQMAKSVIEYLKRMSIKFVVAPYEADPQMVYLEKSGQADAIISEDSDLLVFGATILLTKLNEFGECVEINRNDFKKCRNAPIGLMSQSQMRIVACLSGCDYTNGIPNVGIIKALKLVNRIPNMKRCISNLKLEGKVQIPPNFEDEYERANISFQFQRVFDPIDGQITTLNQPSELDLKNPLFTECVGHLLENEIHRKIAYAELDPITKEPLLARDAFHDRNVVLGQFSRHQSIPNSATKSFQTVAKKSALSTPVIKKTVKVQSISSFFKTVPSREPVEKLNPTPFRSMSGFSPKPNYPDLSPTSKRRKLFNSTSKLPTTTSRFFRSHTQPTKPLSDLVIQDSPLLFKVSSSQPIELENRKIDIHSSDFELTDIDDDGTTEATETSRMIPDTETKDANCGITGIGNHTVDLNIDENNIEDPSTYNNENALDQPEAKESSIKDSNNGYSAISIGLFEKFAMNKSYAKDGHSSQTSKAPSHEKDEVFSNQNRSSRTPLKPLTNWDRNKPRKTLLKTRGSFIKNTTLDQFIYR